MKAACALHYCAFAGINNSHPLHGGQETSTNELRPRNGELRTTASGQGRMANERKTFNV
ncbi:hypothetical protein [Pricia sp.]|uniref:hypothetical protein n=1 Tax=Pricia sp. TaxID=2268138 RepID=UPI003593F29E